MGNAGGGGGAAGGAASLGPLIPLILMFVVFYFLLIRPQQKKAKQQREMLGALKKGDKVITSVGVIGTITGLTDATITLEIAPNVRVKVARGFVSGLAPKAFE
ncbi:MAG: preprotein translocase subunit YajC [Deltaproteobacteria bacterium]|nr:preprotein translocase subunit YajC [Deltaproteobacteria bacterium]